MISIVRPNNPIHGTIQLPGSKSISNRLLILNAILKTDFSIANLSNADDTQLLQKALLQINENKDHVIDVHHAGTDLRFLTAFLSVSNGTWILTGSAQLKKRPVKPLVDALQKMGADISYLETEGFPPLKITGNKNLSSDVEIDASVSSQFLSALLLIAPALKNGITITYSGKLASPSYLNMTMELLRQFGFTIQHHKNNISLSSLSTVKNIRNFEVESDWSAASYYYSICALSPGAIIKLKTIHQNSLQADAILPKIYNRLGVESEFTANELILRHKKTELSSFEYDFIDCPDIAQTVAVTCFALGIKAYLKGLSTLKIKETDRIVALKNELEKFGAMVETGNDYLIVTPGSVGKTHHSKLVETYEDHRMAMSFAPLALKCDDLRIQNPNVVGKSYPAFWEDLLSLGFSVNL